VVCRVTGTLPLARLAVVGFKYDGMELTEAPPAWFMTSIVSGRMATKLSPQELRSCKGTFDASAWLVVASFDGATLTEEDGISICMGGGRLGLARRDDP
jgi:hypothetical protein